MSSEARADDPAEDVTTGGYVPGQRRRIYPMQPDEGMVDRFMRGTGLTLRRQEVREGLAAAMNPAVEDAGCGSGLLAWHRGENGAHVIDGHERCPLASGHHGKHVTPDGLHVWADPDDEDDEDDE